MGLQVAMLATGATLVIDHSASAGGMLAASIIMGRLLFPFEQMIEGWKQWTNALSALNRLRTLLASAWLTGAASASRRRRASWPLRASPSFPGGATARF